MKLIFFSLAMLCSLVNAVKAQNYYTKNGNISFFSKSSMENIKAENNQVMSVLNTQTGDFQFSLLIKGFHFQKALMEEHFNENYMESEKFPKATFKGNIADINRVYFSKDGIYSVSVSGDMTIHGVAKKLTSGGTITITGGKITASSKFLIRLSDYDIIIPNLVKDKIAESIEVNVASAFDQKM